MVFSPLRNSALEDFRKETGSQAAPPFFNSEQPIVPTIVVGGNIGVIKPRANQRLKTYYFVHTANTEAQVATVTSSKKIYLIGYIATIVTGAGGSLNSHVFDRTTGTTRTTADTDIPIYRTVGTASTTASFSDIFAIPIEMKIGLRLYTALAASSSVEGVVYYLEEDVF